MTLEISDIVRITDQLQPVGSLRRELGRTLFLTTDDTVLAAGGADKVRAYGRFEDVAADFFDPDDEVYKAAAAYFGQSIYPRNFMVGRWVNVGANTIIYSGRIAASVNDLKVSDGAFQLDGTDISGIDTSSANSYADIAAALQTALRAASAADAQNDQRLTGATCSYDNQRMQLTFPQNPEFSSLFSTHSQGTGTDISGLLQLRDSQNASQIVGHAQESVAEALSNINEIDDSFYFVVLESEFNGTQTMYDASAWTTAATRKMFIAESNDSRDLEGSHGLGLTGLSVLQPPRTLMVWSATADYKAASIAAYMSSMNLNQPASMRTLKFKSLPSTAPDNVTLSQKSSLDSRRINHYSPYGGVNMVAEGWLGSGDFIEVRYWLDWFVESIQSAVFNHLRNASVIPMTASGLATIRNVIEGVCRQGISNGGLHSGQVNPALAGEIRQVLPAFDGNLTNGYLIFIPPVEATHRTSRRTPGIKIFGRGGSAVHFVDIAITFQGA